MSFRISVESVVYRQDGDLPGEVLLVKRAPKSKVAPNVWHVPAGKVEMLEKTYEAVVRETSEETGLRVKVLCLLSEEAVEMKAGDEKVNRNIFTYLTELSSPDQKVELNQEHTTFEWVTKEKIHLEDYDSLLPRLKEVILEVFKSFNSLKKEEWMMRH